MRPNQLDSSDVTLILKHGKEIKARRNDLSAASDFFSALFNSDMRETREGVIRLEHITETVMRTVLEFMRTGNVTAPTSENAEDLIDAADHFLLPELKTIVKSCVKLDLTSRIAFHVIISPRNTCLRTMWPNVGSLSFPSLTEWLYVMDFLIQKANK